MDGYSKNRSAYSDCSGSVIVGALTGGPLTLKAVPVYANSPFTMFVQAVYATITTPQAGLTWTVQDSNGVLVCVIPTDSVTAKGAALGASPAGGFKFNLGARGVALTPGANLVLTLSGGGAAGLVSWDAYYRQLSTIY